MSLNVLQEPNEAAEAAPEKRGVENPRIVDLIAPDRERGEVVLKILEPRPWGAEPRQLHQLEDKLNSYFSYVLDGFLVQQYPQYEDMPVCIRLECAQEPTDQERDFLLAARGFSARHQIRFEVEQVDEPLGEPFEWEAPEDEEGP